MTRRTCNRCHDCGEPVRLVPSDILGDSEEWCDRCQRYQRPAAHGWPRVYRDLSPCPDSANGDAGVEARLSEAGRRARARGLEILEGGAQ